ncbi:MvdC/MvdD family ATP grasp protein [Paraburkholderia phenoliruptrix]|uniref:MvdC/MvdD family ATP grasp protein n=1 Tax=Paraburkholderia phenoliruptrix TaxID=252970 RepID=UPI002869AC33|nr:hypothetical protein [Paraburkholderia phenoliruptrix]WMY11309.1 hypothetical protein P3F88_32185 [Paraburkholderia phenoliruptrix]
MTFPEKRREEENVSSRSQPSASDSSKDVRRKIISRSVLVVTNRQDVTTDFVILEMQRRGVPYVRLNSEYLAQGILRLTPESGAHGFQLTIGERLVSLAEFGAAYYRRPGVPHAAGLVPEQYLAYCEGEWGASLRALYAFLETRWLNSPQRIDAAENKPYQLFIASALGFSIPETCITNDAREARRLLAGGKTIGKPLRTALIGIANDERVIFTEQIADASAIDDAAVAVAPIIFQRQIVKALDVRVTVVGNAVFSVAIHSQTTVESSVDWRRGNNPHLEHSVVQLPPDIREKCVAIVKRFGLRFGAIDLVLDTDNKYWFLEINPNGQWAWIETRTGLPITAAIVDELQSICDEAH